MISETTETFAEIGTPANPFPGLRPFEFDESHLFFGRDGQSEQLISKLGRSRFLAVVGTSGSGKSSLVRAGLLPALLGGFMTSAGSEWRIAIMRPGSDPIGNLAQALNSDAVFGSEIEENAAIQTAIAEATLRRGNLGLVDAVRQAAMPDNENLLVVVDQFEEIFRFARVSEGEAYHNDAAAFVKLILEASGQREIPIYVVLTMRSDYLGDCSQFWDLPEAINESQYLIPRLTRDQLREAITGPAAVGLGTITPRLVNRLLNDVGDDQDQLPILQHALMRTWDKWKEGHQEGEPLDLPGYEAIGTMSSALSDHADEAYDELPNERSKEIAEKIYKGLTEKGADNREVRRPIELKGLCALAEANEAEVVAVIDVFRKEGRSFLMPPSGTALTGVSLIDISHESLIRNWKRLKEWVEQESRSARIYRRLAETAVLHSEGRAGLWRDPDLQIALTWREQAKPNQVWAQRYHPEFAMAMKFLDDSVAARNAQIAGEEARRKKEIKRTRITALIFLVATVFSLAMGVYAYGKKNEAASALAEANRQRVMAEEAQGKADLLALLASEAQRKADIQTKVADEAKVRANTEEQAAKRLGESLKTSNQSLEASNKSLEDAKTHLENQIVIAENARATAFARQLAAQSENARGSSAESLELSALLAIESLKQPTLEGDQALRKDLALLPRRLESWECDIGSQQKVWTIQNGEYLAALMEDLSVEIWDTATRKSKKLPVKLKGENPRLVLNHKGRFLVTAAGGITQVWDAASGQPVGPPITRKEPFTAVAVSRDGKRLAVESCFRPVEGRFADDCGAEILDAATGAAVGTPMLQDKTFKTNRIKDMAFSDDGELLATAGNPVNYRADQSLVYIWDVATNKLNGEPLNLGPSTSRALKVIFSPNKQYLVTAGWDHIYKIWSVATHQEIGRVTIEDGTPAMAFSDNSDFLALGGREDAVRVFSLKPQSQGLLVDEVARLKVSGAVDAFAFNSKGHLLTVRDKSTVESWNIIDNDEATNVPQSEVREWMRPTAQFSGNPKPESRTDELQANSPDGKFVARGTKDGAIRISFATTSENVCRIKAKGRLEELMFSPSGKRLVTFSVIGGAVPEEKWLTQIWDAADGNPIGEPGTTTGRRLLTIFSPDSKWLAGVVGKLDDRAVSVWEVNTGRQTWKEMFFNADVLWLAFTPDGKYLAALTSKDFNLIRDFGYKIQVFEIASQQKVTERASERGMIGFSPDGKYLLNVDGAITRVWLWRPQDLMGEACLRLRRSFTDAELREFFGSQQYVPSCKIPVDPDEVRDPH